MLTMLYTAEDTTLLILIYLLSLLKVLNNISKDYISQPNQTNLVSNILY